MDEEALRQPVIDDEQLDRVIDISEIDEHLEDKADGIFNRFSQLQIKYQALIKTRKHHLSGN
jgi:inorganic pyrophosphatase